MIYRLLYIVVLLISRIPLSVGQFMGKMVGSVFAVIPSKRAAVSLDNIQKSFGDSMEGAEGRKLNRRVLIHFGEMFFEIPHIMRLNHRNLSKYVVFDQEENYLRAMEKGKEYPGFKDHFADIINENDDAITADILMQLAVMGEIVFG